MSEEIRKRLDFPNTLIQSQVRKLLFGVYHMWHEYIDWSTHRHLYLLKNKFFIWNPWGRILSEMSSGWWDPALLLLTIPFQVSYLIPWSIAKVPLWTGWDRTSCCLIQPKQRYCYYIEVRDLDSDRFGVGCILLEIRDSWILERFLILSCHWICWWHLQQLTL